MTAVDLAGFWWTMIRASATAGWRWLPGPPPVKIAVLLLIAAGQLIPGELDEVALIAVIGWLKHRHTRRRT